MTKNPELIARIKQQRKVDKSYNEKRNKCPLSSASAIYKCTTSAELHIFGKENDSEIPLSITV